MQGNTKLKQNILGSNSLKETAGMISKEVFKDRQAM